MHSLNIDPWFVEKAKESRGGRLHAYETLDGGQTALVVVDMQNYFVADGMPACAPVARTIVPNVNRLARATRAVGGTVIWIQTEALIEDPGDWANRKEATSAARWTRRQTLLARSGDGFPIYPTCEVAPEDRIAIKYRYSAFIPYPSELEGLLRKGGIDTLLITGVATSTCCESTARDASMWGYRTIMVADGNADQTDALHNHTLGKFLVTFGDVQTTDEVLARLTRAPRRETMAQKDGASVETLKAIAAAFNAHDLDAIMEFFAEDCSLDMPRGPEPWGQRFEGKAAVREGLATRFKGLPDVHYGDDRHWVSGNLGVSEWLLTGTTPDGRSVRVRGCDHWEFRDGKVVRKDSYWKIVEKSA